MQILYIYQSISCLLLERTSGAFTIVSNMSLKCLLHKQAPIIPVYAGEVKRHYVCKRHGLLDTCGKQAGRRHFSMLAVAIFPRYPNGIKT